MKLLVLRMGPEKSSVLQLTLLIKKGYSVYKTKRVKFSLLRHRIYRFCVIEISNIYVCVFVCKTLHGVLEIKSHFFRLL
jgi:hypothetical protein